MTYASQKHRTPPAISATDVWTPGDEIEMDALIAACALVAQADGSVRREERQRMIERLRRSPAVAVFGVEEVLQGFAVLNERFERDLGDGVAAAETAVRRLAGHSGASRLLVETACAVAAADGIFDVEERDVVLRLCELLDLVPATFEDVAGQGRGR